MKGQFGKRRLGWSIIAGDDLRGKEIERGARRKRTIKGVIQKGWIYYMGEKLGKYRKCEGSSLHIRHWFGPRKLAPPSSCRALTKFVGREETPFGMTVRRGGKGEEEDFVRASRLIFIYLKKKGGGEFVDTTLPVTAGATPKV